MDKEKYSGGRIIEERLGYYIVEFNTQNAPAMGDNGFMVRKSIIEKINTDPAKFIHVDDFYELLKKEHHKVGAVKNEIIHFCGSNILKQYQNRVLVKKIFYDEKRGKRKYLVFDPHSVREKRNLMAFIIFSLTFIVPLLRSMKGYLKVREPAWFLHPVVCVVAFFMYTKSEVSFISEKYLD